MAPQRVCQKKDPDPSSATTSATTSTTHLTHRTPPDRTEFGRIVRRVAKRWLENKDVIKAVSRVRVALGMEDSSSLLNDPMEAIRIAKIQLDEANQKLLEDKKDLEMREARLALELADLEELHETMDFRTGRPALPPRTVRSSRATHNFEGITIVPIPLAPLTPHPANLQQLRRTEPNSPLAPRTLTRLTISGSPFSYFPSFADYAIICPHRCH